MAKKKRKKKVGFAKLPKAKRREIAKKGAKARWEKYYSKLPKYSLEELKKINAKRSPRSRKQDARKTAKAVLEPTDPRVALWVKNPSKYDVEGIDTARNRAKKKKKTKTATIIHWKLPSGAEVIDVEAEEPLPRDLVKRLKLFPNGTTVIGGKRYVYTMDAVTIDTLHEKNITTSRIIAIIKKRLEERGYTVRKENAKMID